MRQTWDEYFLGIAEAVSKRSKDPSTKCGAVIVRPDRTIAATGYNGFPRDIEDKPELLADREEKLKRVIHAEMNAILTAREPIKGYTLYTYPFLTCERCAVHVIQAGIVRVVAMPPNLEQIERWSHSLSLARKLYIEANVEVCESMPKENEPPKQQKEDKHCPCCGKDNYSYQPVNGHYETTCCHQTLASCCEGPVSVLP